MAGQLTTHDDAVRSLEAHLLLEGLYRRYGMDFRRFEKTRVLRQLDQLVELHALTSISSLQEKVLHDPLFARSVIRALSVSASALFDSPSTLTAFGYAAVSMLRSSAWPLIWLPECSDPALVQAVVALLAEHGVMKKAQVFVTHSNEDVVREGRESMARVSADCAQGEVIFAHFDLTKGASFNEFHAIICQRPLADYDHELQRFVVNLFAESLCNFGLLQIDADGTAVSSLLGRRFRHILGDYGVFQREPAVAIAAS
jgi:chemotaxis protein methyltransferase CheR